MLVGDACILSHPSSLYWIIYIGDVILAKTLATATEYVLALAILGNVTKNRNHPIFCRAACLSLSRALSR
jgi:hypothetical protein